MQVSRWKLKHGILFSVYTAVNLLNYARKSLAIIEKNRTQVKFFLNPCYNLWKLNSLTNLLNSKKIEGTLFSHNLILDWTKNEEKQNLAGVN